MDKMQIYNRLPVWGQNFACYYEGYKIKRTRYGADFWKKLEEYEKRSSWSYDQLCEYRDKRIQKMVMHCYQTVPYYTKLFKDGGINAQSIKTLDDLKVIPVLTKQMVQKQPEAFLSTALAKTEMVKTHTSGTTGSGFIFNTTQEAVCEQWAVWWRFRRRLGIQYGTLCGQFGGRNVVPIKKTTPPFFRWNRPNHMMYFSTYHMNEKNMPEYIDELKKNKVTWLHGYPSALNVLAEYLCTHHVDLPVHFITTGAENLLPIHREHIWGGFCVQPYQHYGMTEAVANFSEDCEHIMWIDEDFAAVEFLPLENTDACEIIGTCLTNYAMPLLRYRTNDVGIVENTAVGRKILSLDGRIEDYIVMPDGTKVGRLDHVFKDLVNIREAQIVQKDTERILIKVVKGDDYSEKDENRLYTELSMRLKGLKMEVAYVDSIERTAAGKMRFVVSEIGGHIDGR